MAQKYGFMANGTDAARKEFKCLICDTKNPTYSWTDYHGEGCCTKCGTAYQLMAGKLSDGETYPRINVDSKWIPVLRIFYEETKSLNGSGTFMVWHDYPDQLEGANKFSKWFKQHKSEFPELEATRAE